MSKKLILLAVLALIAGGLVATYLIHGSGTQIPNQTLPGVTFPSASNTPSGSTTSATGYLTIDAQDGRKIVVKDFIHNGATVADPANPGRYVVAGSLGYCDAATDCSATDQDAYTIFFEQNTQVFSVGLLQEPLGETRTQAEQFLASTLGIPRTQLCALKYYIGTTYQLNEQYAGDSLGFSMCEGAVKLPQ